MSLVVPLAIRLAGGSQDLHVTREARSLTFRSTIPGGFASCQLQLDRPLSLDPEELQAYSDLIVYDGRSAAVVWQGRLEDPGRGASSSGEVWTVRAVGPAAHARDRSVPLIYVDRSLERWAALLGNRAARSEIITDSSVGGAVQIINQFVRGLVVTAGEGIGRRYDQLVAAGLKLARYSFTWDTGVTDADWRVRMLVGIGSLSDLPTDIAFNVAGGSEARVVITDFVNGTDTLFIHMARIDTGITVANDDTWMSAVALILRSMLFDEAGVEITTGYTLNTITATEVIKDLLGRLLDQYDGATAEIATTTYAIQQLAYPDGVTPARVLDDLMGLESDHYWAAWEDTVNGKARFEWRTWPTTIRYEASAIDGFDSPGSAAELYNAVTVRWRDEGGRIRTERRTGTVGILDDAGLTRQALLNLADEVGTLANAQRAGDEFLLEHSIRPNAGTLTVKRPIQEIEVGRTVSPWEIRPGNLIRVRDVRPNVDALNATDRDAVTIFRIVAVTYNASDNSARLELDSRPRELSGLLVASEQRFEQLRTR